jgi:predicted Zn-dependent protease
MAGHPTWTRAAVLALLTCSLIAAGCSTNPATGESELIFISENQEVAMGREAAPQFEQEFGGKVPNSELQAYVQRIGQSVAAVCDRKDLQYDYVLVSSEVPNAFALPGGRIFITAGLMSRMENERELAAVLGHETGHVCAKHNVKGMQRELGTRAALEIAARLAGLGKTAKDVAEVVRTMGMLRYSRTDEYQADLLGIRYMTRAGYNPWGMVELLTVLLNLHDKEPGSIAEMFQTHPVSSKRIAEAKEIIRTEHPEARETDADPNAARFRKMRSVLFAAVAGLKK